MTVAGKPIPVGLRVDVDTLRGTRQGVPGLLQVLQQHGILGTFYFSVGPDNMGRHLWRLLRPGFLWKMLRSNAASLYGLDILLRGTFWPGPIIADKAGGAITATARQGHETGFHAWDHHRWQSRIDHMTKQEMVASISRGCKALTRLVDQPIHTTAVAGWRATEATIAVKNELGFDYNSDCRGDSIFIPLVAGVEMAPQIPVTLPTYDEIIGSGGIDDHNYNERILDAIVPGKLNVYTIHAEVEGIARIDLFRDLLTRAQARGIQFQPLRNLLQAADPDALPRSAIVQRATSGREGWLSWQAAGG